MYATNYFEESLLNVLRGQTARAPSQLYLALYYNNPGETGMEGTEVAYSGYARQPIEFSTPAKLNGGVGMQNISDITFPTAPVSLGAVNFVGVMDSLTGGNMLLYGEFTESIVVEAQEAPVVVAGEAQWWMMGQMSTAYKTRALNLRRGADILGATPHLALYNGDPESGGMELSGSGYGRVAVDFAAPEEQAGGQLRITNSAAVSMNRAGEAWGTWTHTAVVDAASAGVPIYTLQRVPKEMRKGVMVTLEPGNLSLFLN